MSKPSNLIGQTFGKLVVLERAENDNFGKTRWLCQCECGNKKIINASSLKRGLTVSCGCNKMQKLKEYNLEHTIDETGNMYGKLTVLKRDGENHKDGRAYWICQCECGNQISASGKLLREGKIFSCGCLTQSKGEIKIEQLLRLGNLNFSKEYLVDCRKEKIYQHHKARFDFAIFENDKLKYFIEYDGIQHFQYILKENTTSWNNKENFEKTQERDAIKNQWCKENNIPLIRIPYTHYNNLCLNDLKLETSKFILE